MYSIRDFKSFLSLKENWDNYNSYEFIHRVLSELEQLIYKPNVIRVESIYPSDQEKLDSTKILSIEMHNRVIVEITYEDYVNGIKRYIILKIYSDNNIICCYEKYHTRTIQYEIELKNLKHTIINFFISFSNY